MGLIKAIMGAAGGVLADQWKEFFYCDAIGTDTLVIKGIKRVTGRSSNTKGEDNIITNGSGVAVADGQCMIIVDQGKIVEVCAEPGHFTYDSSSEPSVFSGDLGTAIRQTFENIGQRFTYGGSPGKDQRVYYFNTKEIIGNKYGTSTPVPFRVVDKNINLDIDISIRCNGEYSYKIIDPLLFYTNVCGNVADVYKRDQIDSQLKSELLNALQPAFAKISEMGIRYSALPGYTLEIAQALNEILSSQWGQSRGIQIASFGINAVSAPKEDEDLIKELQRSAVLRDPTMAAATLAGAQATAMQNAANNAGGAMTGFMGMGMAQQAGGMNAQNLFALGQQAQQAAEQQPKSTQESAGAADNQAAIGWDCSSCGHRGNTGKFCQECGKPRPQGTPIYRCDKCGWQPPDPTNPPKFCPECGDPFNEKDIV